MNYQISPIGIVVIGVYSCLIPFVVGWPLAKLLGRFRWKWGVIVPPILVLLAAPWAEEYWIASRFAQACQDAGVHVYKQVEVEGFVDATSIKHRNKSLTSEPKLLYNNATSLAEWDKVGYRFKEQLLSDGGVWHVERRPDGVYYSVLNRPTARYHYKYAYQPTPYRTEESIGWKLERTGVVVIDSQTQEVIAQEIGYNRYPSMVEALWIHLLGSGLTQCPDPGKRTTKEHLPIAALKPISSK